MELALDVRVRAEPGAVRAVVPRVPDVSLRLDCRVRGTASAPSLDGRVSGDGLYSRLALFFADLFTRGELDRCGAGR
jgi:hypothetical protein